MANAKIQYTVRVEEIPLEANKHLADVALSLEKVSNLLSQIAERDQTSAGVHSANDIENIRQDMGLLDLKLEDCYSMLVGYANYQASKLQKLKKEKPSDEQSTD